MSLLKNLKIDRHKKLTLNVTKFLTPQDMRRADDKNKAYKTVKVEAKTGELGRLS
jgi:hypothetical protein